VVSVRKAKTVAKPNEKLASSLEVLRKVQDETGPVVKSSQVSRVHRERLQKAGYLTDIANGWLITTRPQDRAGDSTFWYVSFWEFCKRYCEDRFGSDWCLSPEHSLVMHAESTTIPRQVIVWSPTGSRNNKELPFETSLYDHQTELPAPADRAETNGVRLIGKELALCKVTEAFFQTHAPEVQITLNGLKSVTPLLARLLDGGHVNASGRIVGALRKMGRDKDADLILKKMGDAGYDVREKDPFGVVALAPRIANGTSPLVMRILQVWEKERDGIIDRFPKPSPLPRDPATYLAAVDEIYVNDAYNSLSIEGYRVTPELIDKIRAGAFDPEGNPEDREDRNALAASGYWQAFQSVRRSIESVLAGQNAGEVAQADHDDWYSALFQPSVDAGILKAGVLAGYRSHPVYLRGSRHTPPRSEAVLDGTEALFDRLRDEPSPAVKAVMGHWLLGYVHPYPDGNGRMARFLMNVMLASGGYPWTIIRLEDRSSYMAALEVASTTTDLRPFADFVATAMARGV